MRFILIICFSLAFSNKLLGQLLFHNTATEDVYVVIKYVENDVWKTQGWYKVGPLQTEQLIEKITNRYYYYYAYNYTNGKKVFWSGSDSWSWVHRTNAFTTIEGQQYPATKGYEKIGLRKVDVQDATKYTLTLDFRSKFLSRMEKYFLESRLDSIEGLYSISDQIEIETIDGNGITDVVRQSKEHWAKVAIVKDTVSLSRSYIELVIEADGFKEGDVKAEFLQTKQSAALFMSEQQIEKEISTQSVVLEFRQDEGIIEGKFEYTNSGKKYIVKRSYLKYFPK